MTNQLTYENFNIATKSNNQVSFDDIYPMSLPFNTSFKCAKSAPGQIIKGLIDMMDNINGTGNYIETYKNATNNYQKYLYPIIVDFIKKIVEKYVADFVTNIINPTMRRIFGEKINGYKNNGQLNKFIPCKNINKFLNYEYAQFGQLIMLLNYRLSFIADKNNEYTENTIEYFHFIELKKKANDFCIFLKDIINKWKAHVHNARKTISSNELIGLKLSVDNIKHKQKIYDQNQYKQYDNYSYKKYYNKYDYNDLYYKNQLATENYNKYNKEYNNNY